MDYEHGDYAAARRPVDWESVFNEQVPRKFTRHEVIKAKHWGT